MAKATKRAPVMTPVESSNIKAIGFDKSRNVLRVAFNKNGTIWEYSPFTQGQYEDFLNAESKGKWFNEHIRFANVQGNKIA